MALTQWIERSPLWARLGLAVVAGALGSFAQAPFDLAVLILVPLMAGFLLLRASGTPRGAFFSGWILGASYFGLSLRWITEPFQIDPALAWMAPIALVLLALLLGLFWGLPMAITRWLSPRNASRLWPLAFLWAGAEMLRGYLFTGFPWANPAQGTVTVTAGQILAFVGPNGLILGLMLTALALVTPQRRRVGQGAKLGFATAAIALLVLPPQIPPAEMTDQVVRIVQPNAPQDQKFHPDFAAEFVRRQIAFTAEDGEEGDPDLVLWPEMAIPYVTSVAGPVFEHAAEAAQGVPVLMGALRDPPDGRAYNAALLIGDDAQIAQHYDKHHLVPFGEYMPFPWLFRNLGIRALADRTRAGYTAGPGPALMDLGDLGQALILICYEAVFPQDLRGTARPDLLVHMTNDAWFGTASGPQQHLAQAQMRAIEQGLPLIRSANTGISALIDPHGRVLEHLPLNTAGFLDVSVPAPRAATLYARTGDLPMLLICLFSLAWAVFQSHRSRHR